MRNFAPDAVIRLKKSLNPYFVQNAVPKIWPDPNSVTSAEKNINFIIDHQCPQCGAPAELNETDRLFQCTFCKVNSYLLERTYFRYVLPHNAPEGQELVYFPYWRFKGMLFSCLPSGIQNRFLDASQQAVESTLFPPSVGLRSQAMKLQFVSPETKGWFIKPTLPFRQVMGTFLTRFNHKMPGTILHQSHIGESLSLIYAPFYVAKRIMDAVLNQPVSEELDEAFNLSFFSGGPADWRIRFIPTLCPNCGWDMQGRRDALVLHCTNCESMWQASKEGMSRVNVAHMPTPEDKNIIFLPFWRIRAEVSGIDLNSYADLVKVANLPKVVQPGWDRIPCHFWSPAFKVRPRSFLRLTHHITLSQPRDHLVADVPKGSMHPVNLPVSESVETLKLNIAGFLRPKKAVEDRIAEIQAKPSRYLLAYLPFEIRHHDLVQNTFNIAVNRNQLALAGNL
jgi:ribosomal protein L37AE/L43A